MDQYGIFACQVLSIIITVATALLIKWAMSPVNGAPDDNEAATFTIASAIFPTIVFLAMIFIGWPLVPEEWHLLGFFVPSIAVGISIADHQCPRLRLFAQRTLWTGASVLIVYLCIFTAHWIGPGGVIRRAGLEALTTIPPPTAAISSTCIPTTVYLTTAVISTTTVYLPHQGFPLASTSTPSSSTPSLPSSLPLPSSSSSSSSSSLSSFS
ncbi:hypothetical protein TWF106_007075 [Orbilia oligospora]|uniref:Uncharacterized protein n=1 Tax=Orbilia oligospora TaxID=2813651 RepID=A0A7C8UT99_ORBOL|nr:hypothetical protein TWF106_007075 [Orbilia oligospora]